MWFNLIIFLNNNNVQSILATWDSSSLEALDLNTHTGKDAGNVCIYRPIALYFRDLQNVWEDAEKSHF